MMRRTWTIWKLPGLYLTLSICSWADLSFDLITIGNPGNAPDHPYTMPELEVGAVNYTYRISTYEVTVGQYTEFLNAKAQSDPYGLYHQDMGGLGPGFGGPFIEQSGVAGSYSYSTVSGKEDQPVRMVDFYDTVRFCNWLHNGQGVGDTENGAYDLSDGVWLERESGASWVLPSEDEWYKAAYYDAINAVYYDYPNGADAVPPEPTDETTPREMNFGGNPYWHGAVCFTHIGETTGQTPYGVCDMGGGGDRVDRLACAPWSGYCSYPARRIILVG